MINRIKRYCYFHKITLQIILFGCIYFSLGDIQSVRSRYAEYASPLTEINSYKKQLAEDSTRLDLRLKLARVYLQIEAYSLAAGEFHEVISTANNSKDDNSGLAEGYYGLGLAYAGMEKFDEAIEAYQDAIKHNPDRAHFHAALGAGYANIHHYDDALITYKIAHDLKSDDAMIHHQLGNIYAKKGKNAEAITHQQKAISLSPIFASAYYELGLLYSQENRLTEAIKAFETAYKQNQEQIEALYNLSQTYLRNGNRQLAREKMHLYEKQKVEIQQLNKLRGASQRTVDQSEKANILSNIGRLYLKNKQFKKAIREYEKSIALNPMGIEAYNGVGIAYAMLDRYSDAIEAQNKALKLQSDFAEAYAGLGLVYFKENKSDLALKNYQNAIKISTKRLKNRKLQLEVEAYQKIGLIHLNKKNYAMAASAYKAIIVLNPNIPDVYHNLGLCYAYQDEYDIAIKTLENALVVADKNNNQINERPNFIPETYFLIGELNLKLNKYDAAESAYLKSNLPKAYNSLAQLYAKLASTLNNQTIRKEKLNMAVSYAKTAIKRNPNIPSYHNTLALIAYKIGDLQTAEQSIRKAIELDPKNPIYKEGLKQILKR